MGDVPDVCGQCGGGACLPVVVVGMQGMGHQLDQVPNRFVLVSDPKWGGVGLVWFVCLGVVSQE